MFLFLLLTCVVLVFSITPTTRMQDVQRDHFPFPGKMYQELPRIQVYGNSDLFFSNLLFICLFGGHAGHLAWIPAAEAEPTSPAETEPTSSAVRAQSPRHRTQGRAEPEL